MMKEARLEVKVEVVDEAGRTLVFSTSKIFGELQVKKFNEDFMVSEVLASGLNGIRVNPNAVAKFKAFEEKPKVVEVIDKPEVKPEVVKVEVEVPKPEPEKTSKKGKKKSSRS